MRRAIVIALTLGAACLLLFGCSSDISPTDPVDTASDQNPDKRPPNIYDPPPDWDPWAATINAAFAGLSWIDTTVTVVPGDTTKVALDGDDPIGLVYELDPMYAYMASSLPSTGWEVTISIPDVAAGLTISLPADCMVFKTKDFPDDLFGAIAMQIPIYDFYDTSDYTDEFTYYWIDEDGTYPQVEDEAAVEAPKWGDPDPEVVVCVELPEVRNKDENDGSEAKHVLDPEDTGPPDPAE